MVQLLSDELLMTLFRKLIVVAALWVLWSSLRHRQWGLAFALFWPLAYYADATMFGSGANVRRDTATFLKTMATFGWVGVLGWTYYAQRKLKWLQVRDDART